MKHNIIICLIVGALCIFGMCHYSNAAPVAEKALIQERILRIQFQIQLLTRQLQEDRTRLDEINAKEAAQKKAQEAHDAKEAEGKEP